VNRILRPFASVLLLAALIVATAPAVAADGSPQPPQLRLPHQAAPQRIEVDLTIRPSEETFGGQVRIALELLEPTRLLWLNGRSLDVSSARLTRGDEAVVATVVPGGIDFVGFDFGAELAPGPGVLEIEYRGKLDPIETEGLFRQQVEDDWYAFTQFESVFARRAFPCFDEPSYRVKWKLALHIPAGLSAVSNTAQVSEKEEADGMKRIEFAETPPIPSYLVALGVGPFEFVDGGKWGRNPTPVRIVVPRGQSAKAAFAAEVTGSILATQEEYFDLPYAFGKLDYLVIPHTVGFGAMENPGLVTYAERGALIDPASATLERQRSYASTTAHENAHMWFGDYVTMAWWNDIWLNEGFATWMGGKTLAMWRPDWWDDGDRFGRRGWAFLADGRPDARQVRREIASTDDIETAFDGIAYGKGGALLQMFETWMGEEKFREAIRHYLRKHAFGNATSDDFLAALAEVGGPEIQPAFASFLDQPGVPIVRFEAACGGDGDRLEVSQRRYSQVGARAAKEELWTIPIAATIAAGERSAPVRLVLDGAAKSVAIPFCPDRISGNGEGAAYYVSEYAEGGVEALARNLAGLPVGEQITLLSDSSMLVSAGSLPPAEALRLLPFFTRSDYRQVISSAVRIASSVDNYLVADEVRPNYQRFVRGLFGARAEELGFTPRPDEDEAERLLRPELLGVMTDEAEDPATLARARELAGLWLDDPSAVDPSVLGEVLRGAARQGDAALYDAFLARAKASKDRRERSTLLAAIGSFRDPVLVRRSLGMLLGGDFDLREASGIMRRLAGDRENREIVWSWLRESWDSYAPMIPEQSRSGLTFIAAGFCDAGRKAEIEEFFGPRLEGVAQGPTRLEQTLSGIDLCVARKEAQQAAVSAFLKGY